MTDQPEFQIAIGQQVITYRREARDDVPIYRIIDSRPRTGDDPPPPAPRYAWTERNGRWVGTPI